MLQVSDTRIVIAVEPSDSASEDLDLPERCRVVKLANSVTYDRYISFAFSEAQNSEQL
jgi:DNA polymerase alpha-associated DNA helicase A